MSRLEQEMRKFLGVVPFGDEPFLKGDKYLWKAMVEEFGEEAVMAMYNKLK